LSEFATKEELEDKADLDEGKLVESQLPDSVVSGSNGPVATPGVPHVYNVKDGAFGAKGDGATDDSVAIQAAITAAGENGEVVIPEGDYVIGTEVFVRHSGVTIRANGRARLIRKTGTNPAALINVVAESGRLSNVTVSGLILDMGYTASDTGHAPRTLTVRATDGIWITDCRVLNSVGAAIHITSSSRIHIRDCEVNKVFEDSGEACNGINLGTTVAGPMHYASVIGCHIFGVPGIGIWANPSGANEEFDCEVVITGNVIDAENSETTHGISHGIFSESVGNNVVISDNVVVRCKERGIGITNAGGGEKEGLPTHLNSVISGNVVDRCKEGIRVSGSKIAITGNVVSDWTKFGIAFDGATLDKLAHRAITITGNVVEGAPTELAEGEGVFVSTTLALEDLIVANNVVRCAGLGQRAIDLTGLISGIVEGNVVSGAGWNGIATRVHGEAKPNGISIIGNRVRNCGKRTGESALRRAGIRIETSLEITVLDNLATDVQAEKTQTYGLSLGEANMGVVARGNDLRGNLTEAFNGLGNASVQTDNLLVAAAYAGTVTLVSGEATVETAAASLSQSIDLWHRNASSNGALFVNQITAGTKFTIKSTNAADASSVGWRIR
jgi:hypothetical protein